MRMPQLNAFVVAEFTPNAEMCWGRVLSLFVGHDSVTLGISVGHKQSFTITCPPWRLLHCHHQPMDFVDKKGRIIEPAADDSPAWRETREAIARACMKCGKHAKRFFPKQQPPQENA